MMRKTLWALSLLFVLSGCNDGGEENPPKQDRLVNTTVNIEYSLNFDTPSVNYPATNNQQSEVLPGIPVIPPSVRMRFVIEFWEEIPLDPADPSAGVTYRRYGRKTAFGISQHIPVAGQSDRYVASNDMRLSKSKFKMLIWVDYVNRQLPGQSLIDAYFSTNRISATDPNNFYGLRYLVMSLDKQRNFYDAFSGVQDVDLTVHQGEEISNTTINASVERVFGKYTLIASDYKEYKESVSPGDFDASKKPIAVRVAYGGAYGEENPENGFRGMYDAMSQNVTAYIANQEMYLPVVSESEDGEELILTFDYILANADNSPLKDVMVTIYGPMGVSLRKIKISELPIERNKETFFRAPFLFNQFSGGDSGITIVDGFDDNGAPEIIPTPGIIP